MANLPEWVPIVLKTVGIFFLSMAGTIIASRLIPKFIHRNDPPPLRPFIGGLQYPFIPETNPVPRRTPTPPAHEPTVEELQAALTPLTETLNRVNAILSEYARQNSQRRVTLGNAYNDLAHQVEAKKTELANRKAEVLLLGHLTDEQKAERQKLGYFTVKGKKGNTYRIHKFGEVYCNDIYLCVMPEKPMPMADRELATKLMIEGAEEKYLKTANANSDYYLKVTVDGRLLQNGKEIDASLHRRTGQHREAAGGLFADAGLYAMYRQIYGNAPPFTPAAQTATPRFVTTNGTADYLDVTAFGDRNRTYLVGGTNGTVIRNGENVTVTTTENHT